MVLLISKIQVVFNNQILVQGEWLSRRDTSKDSECDYGNQMS